MAHPDHIDRIISIPATGPHGLDLDVDNCRLFCACDAGKLFTIDLASDVVTEAASLSGIPDVIFYNQALGHLYVAVGDPGVLDVFDTRSMRKLETIPTVKGAHTIAFDTHHNKVYAFLPQTHQAAVYLDE